MFLGVKDCLSGVRTSIILHIQMIPSLLLLLKKSAQLIVEILWEYEKKPGLKFKMEKIFSMYIKRLLGLLFKKEKNTQASIEVNSLLNI